MSDRPPKQNRDKAYSMDATLVLIIVFSLTALASLGACMAVSRIAPRDFLVANMRGKPNGVVPVRQLGGLAVVPAICLAVLSAKLFLLPGWQTGWMVIVAVVAVGIIGMIDDWRHLGVGLRLLVQISAAAMVVATLGDAQRILPEFVPHSLERALCVLFLVWMINITNFMDGMDLMTVCGLGLPALLVAVALALYGIIGLPLVVAAAMAGALAGFAPFNLPPARLYLGDSGSLALGLCAGFVSLHLMVLAGPLAGLIPFAYYHLDAGLTILLRLRDGENILRSHTRHFYQRAIRQGIPVRRVLGTICLIALALFAILAALLALR